MFASTFLCGAVFQSLLNQDPRYFYRGTGSTKKRILYALSNSVVCKGDNGPWQVNYSNMEGVVSGAASEDFRKEVADIRDTTTRRFYILAKLNNLAHFRAAEFKTLIADC